MLVGATLAVFGYWGLEGSISITRSTHAEGSGLGGVKAAWLVTKLDAVEAEGLVDVR
jgi:hypothetical protein